MKKFKYGLVMALFLVMTTITKNEVRASSATEIPVTSVSDINNEAVNVKSVGDTLDEADKSYTKAFYFILKKPAYIVTSAQSTVSYEGYSSLNNIAYTLSYDASGNSQVKGANEIIEVTSRKPYKGYYVLDAGTYYINVAIDQFASYPHESGNYSFSVRAQYMNSASWNTTKAKAVNVKTDKDNKGAITATTRNSWHKFSVAETTTVNIRSYIDNAWGGEVGNLKNGICAATLWNSGNKPVAYWNIPNVAGGAHPSGNITLKKGTYYLSFYSDKYFQYSTYGALGMDVYNNKLQYKIIDSDYSSSKYLRNSGEVNFRITSIKNPKNIALKNIAKNKVRVTFQAVSGAKGYQVQYSINKNYIRAKNETITMPSITLTNLEKDKTYYVRARAYRYDEGRTKVYSGWVSKQVKIKK